MIAHAEHDLCLRIDQPEVGQRKPPGVDRPGQRIRPVREVGAQRQARGEAGEGDVERVRIELRSSQHQRPARAPVDKARIERGIAGEHTLRGERERHRQPSARQPCEALLCEAVDFDRAAFQGLDGKPVLDRQRGERAVELRAQPHARQRRIGHQQLGAVEHRVDHQPPRAIPPEIERTVRHQVQCRPLRGEPSVEDIARESPAEHQPQRLAHRL